MWSGVGNKNEKKEREIKGESAKISERQFIKYILWNFGKEGEGPNVLVVR